MSVVEFNEFDQQRQQSVDDKLIRKYIRTFKVICDDIFDGPLVVRLHPSCPKIHDIYVDSSGAVDLGARCRNVTVDATDEPTIWMVTAEYATILTPPDKVDDPLLRPAEVQISFQKRKVVVDRDVVTDQPIRNSANQAPDPRPEREDCLPVITVTRNEATVSLAVAYAFMNSVNDSTFLGAPEHTVLLSDISAKRVYEEGQYYWQVNYQFVYNGQLDHLGQPLGWDLEFLDQGYCTLNTTTGKLEQIHDDTGAPANSQYPLDGAGQKLALSGSPTFHWRGPYALNTRQDHNLLIAGATLTI